MSSHTLRTYLIPVLNSSLLSCMKGEDAILPGVNGLGLPAARVSGMISTTSV